MSCPDMIGVSADPYKPNADDIVCADVLQVRMRVSGVHGPNSLRCGGHGCQAICPLQKKPVRAL